jgi:hypothetical protein
MSSSQAVDLYISVFRDVTPCSPVDGCHCVLHLSLRNLCPEDSIFRYNVIRIVTYVLSSSQNRHEITVIKHQKISAGGNFCQWRRTDRHERNGAYSHGLCRAVVWRHRTWLQLKYSKPSLIRLQIIRIDIWQMKNSVHSWVHTLKRHMGFRSKRTFRRCWDWNHARKYPRTAWAGWRRPWILAADRGRNDCSYIFYSCFLSFLLNESGLLLNPQIITTREGLLYMRAGGGGCSLLFRANGSGRSVFSVWNERCK